MSILIKKLFSICYFFRILIRNLTENAVNNQATQLLAFVPNLTSNALKLSMHALACSMTLLLLYNSWSKY